MPRHIDLANTTEFARLRYSQPVPFSGVHKCGDVDALAPAGAAGCAMGDNYQRSAGLVSRPAEADCVATFVASAVREPAALIVEGEPGIGKTTVWLAALDRARELDFRVLSTRSAAVESGLAYASLADLLRGVEAATFDRLPRPQKVAIDQILLRASEDGAATDQRAVSAAFLAIIEMLSEKSPVLIAIDDLQWLDLSSRHVLAFAVRRLGSRVGVVGTVRSDAASDTPWSSWFEFVKSDSVQRIHLGPLSLGALHAVVSERVGRSFPRPTIARIFEVSRGNPFYAIEFARVIETRSPVGEVPLPRTLSEVVQSRLDSLGSDLPEALLVVACLKAATTEQVALATDIAADRVMELVEQAEAKGILEIHGSRWEFAHPLLARGVYDFAPPARRRMMHRRLAQIVDQPEMRARHLALGATREDPTTLQALDAAAESARIRGAPDAAAELLELAIRLGGDTPGRRIDTATHHFAAGDTGRARSLLEDAIAQMPRGADRAEALITLAVVRLDGDSFAEAAHLLKEGLDDSAGNAELRVRMLNTLSYALLNAGDTAAAARIVDDAVSEAVELGNPHLVSMAQSMRAVQQFMRGDGFDEISMRKAILTEDRNANVPLAFRPHVQYAMLLGLIGKLEDARREMLLIRRACVDRGGESELLFVGFHSVLQAVWHGDMSEAALMAEDTMERALLLGGDFPRIHRADVASHRRGLQRPGGSRTARRRRGAGCRAAQQRAHAAWVDSQYVGLPRGVVGELFGGGGCIGAAADHAFRAAAGNGSHPSLMSARCDRGIDSIGSARSSGRADSDNRVQREAAGSPVDVGGRRALPRHGAGRRR